MDIHTKCPFRNLGSRYRLKIILELDIHTKCPFRNLGSRYRLKIIFELQQTVGGGTACKNAPDVVLCHRRGAEGTEASDAVATPADAQNTHDSGT